jgi:hypothetical protein
LRHDDHLELGRRPAVADVLARLRDTGFLVVPDLLSASECEGYRRAYAQILELEKEENRHPSGHQRILHLLPKAPMFSRLLVNPYVLAVWQEYLGSEVVCSTMTGNALWPGSTELYWHADHPYWTMAQPYSTAPLCGQVIWMLDDFTLENGATAAIAGSHMRGHLPPYEEKWVPEAVVLEGRAGSAILADGGWWHTSRPNRTSALRCAVLVTYIQSHCVTQEDMEFQLEELEDPSDEVARLLGRDRYRPRRTFPY